MKLPVGFAYVFVLSAVLTFSYDAFIDSIRGVTEGKDARRRMDTDEETYKRFMEVFKNTWPECVRNKMTAIECKLFIDDEIFNTFTGRDKYIRVIIKDKRKPTDEWYNTVVITMDDSNMVVGIENDGLIDYEFEWESSGQEANPDQQSEIPPVIATETVAGSPLSEPLGADPTSPEYLPQADPTSEEYEPLVFEEEPIMVVGCTVRGALLGTDENPVAGGVVIDPETPNTPEGDAKLQDVIAETTSDPAANTTDDTGGLATIEEGPRNLETFNCTGLTGNACCLMIKLKVPDSDANGNAIQCQLVYEKESNKNKYWLNARGKKVFIFANHNGLVSKVPEIVGDWPKGQADGAEFDQWLADGGDPNQVLEGY